jgi:hypothetical protein
MRLLYPCLCLVLFASRQAAAQSAGSIDPASFRQIADVWALVRYRHPWGYRPDFDVDAAAVSALGELRGANADSVLRRALSRLLEGAADPATRSVPAAESPRLTADSTAPGTTSRTSDGIVVVTLKDYRSLSNRGLLPDYAGRRLASLHSALADARAVVVDVRTDDTSPLPAGDDDVGVVRDFIAEILRETTTRTLTPPGERRVIRRTFSERDGSPPAEFLTAPVLPILPTAGARDIPAVLIVNENSVLPPYAAALLREGLVAMVAEGDAADAPFAPFVTMHVRNTVIRMRIADLVDVDGQSPPLPTAVLPRPTSTSGDSALATAMALARAGPPFPVVPGPRRDMVPVRTNPTTSRMDMPSLGERRFALLKIIGVLASFYPDFDSTVASLNGLIAEFLPRLDSAATLLDYHLTVATLTNRMRDSHARVDTPELNAFRGLARLPALLEIVEGRLTVVEVAHDSLRAGVSLVRGDIVVSIDGEDAIMNGRRIAETYSSSTPWRADLDAERSAGRGPVGSTATIVVEDGSGVRRTTTVRRVASVSLMADLRTRAEPAVRQLAPGIGYMDVGRVPADGFSAAFRQLADMRGIIFDWRTSSGTTWETVSRLLPPSNPDAHPAEHFGGAAIVIQSPIAQSSAEVNGAILRRALATPFLGATTSGTHGGTAQIVLPSGIRFNLTSNCAKSEGDIGRCAGPDRMGLRPDVPVARTRAGVRAGRDEVLDAALRHIETLLRR